MLIGIVFAIITFIAGFIDSIYDNAYGFFSYLGSFFLHLIVTGFMFLAGCLLAVIIGLYMPKHWEETTTSLASLKDASGIEGSFILGTGYIESTQYYIWYEKTDEGYIPQKVEVSTNVLISEDSTLVNTGTLKVSARKMNNHSLSHWLVFDVSTWHDKYKFTIPVGSIKKDFKL